MGRSPAARIESSARPRLPVPFLGLALAAFIMGAPLGSLGHSGASARSGGACMCDQTSLYIVELRKGEEECAYDDSDAGQGKA